MNDSLSGKNGKVKVMYVRSDDEGIGSQKNTQPARHRQEKEKHQRFVSRDKMPQRGDRSCRQTCYQDNASHSSSPWKTITREETKEWVEEEEISRKRVDPGLIRRQRSEETRVYGENACQALFNHRPDAIVKAWFVQSVTPRFREALRWMAANRKAYHVVDEAELVKASGTEHHGGVCFIIKKRQGCSVIDYLSQVSDERDCVLALGEVGNPHNLGGMMRSCAHFGVHGVVLRDLSLLDSGAAVRTAEGGVEHIQAIDGEDLLSVLDTLRHAGYTIVTTTSHKGTGLTQVTLPAKMVLVLGQENDELSSNVWKRGDISLSIDGTGKVDSLNVSVATGILLAEWWRQNSV